MCMDNKCVLMAHWTIVIICKWLESSWMRTSNHSPVSQDFSVLKNTVGHLRTHTLVA